VTAPSTASDLERVSALRSALLQADRRTDQEWRVGLEPRKLAELDFHDWERTIVPEEQAGATVARETANKKYYSTVGLSRKYAIRWIEERARGRVFLDYACGTGENALLAARAGAALSVGLDISRVSIDTCRRRAREQGLDGNTIFVQGDCESTGLPSGAFDAIICSGMLHHLDLSYAFPEIRRLLKPAGRCLAVEALNYNPVIKLYRWLTPGLRTEWEKRHILSLKDVRFAHRFFEIENVRYWHLFSILSTPLRRTPLFDAALKLGNAVDRAALRIPGVAQMAWIFTFEMVKRSE
jgi:SAM-dependent methyltransferase